MMDVVPFFIAALLQTNAVADPCAAVDVEYAVAGNLRLKDTPMGKGDGIYPVGPGRAVIRFEGSRATLRSYTMEQHFTIKPSAVFWSATLVTNARAVMPENGSLEGTFDGRTIVWRGGVPGYRIDGTLHCSGSLCGKFGAPPAGLSEMHVGPYTQAFKPFELSPDRTTFTMQSVAGPRTESPKQSSEVSIAGREIRRTCVTPAF